MDKKIISNRHADYVNCKMSEFEFQRELISQKILLDDHKNEANILFLGLIALISVSSALYVYRYQKWDLWITIFVIILGVLFAVLYRSARKKQKEAKLNIMVLTEFRTNLILGDKKSVCKEVCSLIDESETFVVKINKINN